MANSGPITSLNFTDDQINLDMMWNDNLSRTQTLHVSSMESILSQLRHEPPTAYELEAAIADIEDALMPIIPMLPEHRYLVTSEPAISQIAKAAGIDDGEQIDLAMETVELLYTRLADLAYGTPLARLGVPGNRLFAATVLFLRELMHHAGFDAVHIHPS